MLRTLARDVSWWLALVVAWCALAGYLSRWVVLWGAVLAVVPTVAAMVAVRRRPGSDAAPARRVREALAAAKQVVPDFAVLAGELGRAMRSGDRGPRGAFVRRGGQPTEERGGGRRAWVALAATYSPNAYVVDVDPDSGEAELHDLRVLRSSEEPL